MKTILFIVALMFTGMAAFANPPASDTMALQTDTGLALTFTGCTVTTNTPTVFAVDCKHVEGEGNTVFASGPATKQESLYVNINGASFFRNYANTCFQVGFQKFRGHNFYQIECYSPPPPPGCGGNTGKICP